jgi:hypothetical protein
MKWQDSRDTKHSLPYRERLILGRRIIGSWSGGEVKVRVVFVLQVRSIGQGEEG